MNAPTPRPGSVAIFNAAEYLADQGLEILCRDWSPTPTAPGGNRLHIVARDAGVTAFVEVLTGHRPGPVVISDDEQRRIRQLVLQWLHNEYGPFHRIRFDAVTIHETTSGAMQFAHHKSVF